MKQQEKLGRDIRNARGALDWSQQDLADKISIDRSELSNYELGKVKANLYVIVEIAKALRTEFTVDGYRIGPDRSVPPLPEPPSEQLCIQFDREHSLEGTTLKIKPTKEGILITGIVSRIKPA